MDGGASWATVHEVGKSLTQLSDFTFTSFWYKEAVFSPFPSFSCPYSLFSLLYPFLQSILSVIAFFLFPTTHLPCFLSSSYTLELICLEEAPEGPLI